MSTRRDREPARDWSPGLLVLTSVVIWGCTARVTAEVGSHARPLTLTSLRAAPAALILLAVLPLLRARLPRDRRVWAWTGVSGLLMVTVFLGGFTEAIIRAGPGNAVVLASTPPFFIVLLSRILYGDRVSLQALSADERRILSLHVINQLTYKEIARHLNKPAGTVQKAGRRAILKLRKRRGLFWWSVLLTVGIVMGGMWANEAWGRFWGWDPKETWALITWVVYAGYLHTRITLGWAGKRPAAIAVFAFAVVVFTFMGVNLGLTGEGLHTYGSG